VEEVAHGAAAAQVDAPAAQVLGPVVAEVAALAERAEVAEGRVLRVVVEVGRAEVDEARASGRVLDDVRPGGRPARVVAPAPGRLVPPPPVGELGDGRAVRPAARLAAAERPAEPDQAADQRPVDRVEPAQLAADRHRDPGGDAAAPAGLRAAILPGAARRGSGSPGVRPRQGASPLGTDRPPPAGRPAPAVDARREHRLGCAEAAPATLPKGPGALTRVTTGAMMRRKRSRLATIPGPGATPP
jgi:hypothetical protein